MVPVSQLQAARKYPFSSVAKNAVKQLAPSLVEIDRKAFDSAFALIEAAASTNPKERRAFVEHHTGKKDLSYPEFLANDVLAYPLAKILLSQVRNPILYAKFADLMGDLTFEYVANERERIPALLDLAAELHLKMEPVSVSGGALFHVPLVQYVSVPFRDGQLHLVHQSVQKGKVELDMNSASRWLAEAVHALVLASLPVDVKGLPQPFGEMASQLQSRLQARHAEESKLSITGGVILSAFPPCMEKLHSEITSGVNLPHMARFDLATFLVNVHMPYEDIVSVFAKASNYDERITRYHVENLSGRSSGKQYSAPACTKVREHGLCISRTCNVTHPLQFYRRAIEQGSAAAISMDSPESTDEK